jgi:hypothetical protein
MVYQDRDNECPTVDKMAILLLQDHSTMLIQFLGGANSLTFTHSWS